MGYLICFVVLSFVLVIESAPHEDVHDINEQLHVQGFDMLTSEDDFTKSATCTVCGWKITYHDRAKAVWLIKRHSNENSHKVKAGWFLSADNKVLASKPKGKLNLNSSNRLFSQNDLDLENCEKSVKRSFPLLVWRFLTIISTNYELSLIVMKEKKPIQPVSRLVLGLLWFSQ